jgi:D-3-phosphoglycerate dehydrogenase
VRQGAWDRERFPSFLLDGKTMGIVGFGRLGAKVAQFARAFNMEIIAYDPLVTNWPTFVSSISLEKLFSQADVISLHVHLTEETKSFINAPLLAQIRPGAFLINTSRGGLIDETALLDGLRTGRIRGAALDVMNGEPAVAQSPLVEFARNNPNLIITPHCAGYSPEAVDKVCIRAASKVVEFFRSNSKDD